VLEHVLERSEKICVNWIRPIRVCGQVPPVLVHPEPGRRVFLGVWFKGIPTRLCDLLMSHFSGALDLGMEDYPVASIRQRLAMRWDNRDAGLLMEPGMCESHASFNPKQSIATAPCVGGTVRSTSSAVRPFRRSTL